MSNMLKKIGSLTVLLFVLSWTTAAHSSVMGIVVDDNTKMTSTGGIQDSNGEVTYYIPLAQSYGGVYGTMGTGGCAIIGTCSDSGSGYRYDEADGLTMNIYFDLSGLSNRDNAILEIEFDDLDLVGINDPDWFYESVSLKANNGGPAEINLGPYKENTDIPGAISDPFTWSLDLASLGTLKDDFWIELGFGSDTSGKHARNTAEYLSASISAVPVPGAVWLFGTALLGLVGFSKRRKAA
jgi:hypothetical protein